MDINKPKKIWKKKIFSNRDPETNAEFQTQHMIDKIMRTNKKKRRAIHYNYKNIETFENIHESNAYANNVDSLVEPIIDGSHSGDLATDGTWADSEGKVERGFFDETDGTYYVIDLSGNKTRYDGPDQDGIPLTPDFWEGLDSGDRGMSADDPREKIMKFLDQAEAWIDNINDKAAHMFANATQQSVALDRTAYVYRDFNVLQVDDISNLAPGMKVVADGVPMGAVIKSIGSGTFIISEGFTEGIQVNAPAQIRIQQQLQQPANVNNKLNKLLAAQNAATLSGVTTTKPSTMTTAKPSTMTTAKPSATTTPAAVIVTTPKSITTTTTPKPTSRPKPAVNSKTVFINMTCTRSSNINVKFYATPATDADVAVIKPYISLLQSVIFAFIFTYNIMYATVYVDPATKKNIYIPRFTSDALRIMTLNRGYGFIVKPLVFLFIYALYFSDMLQSYIYDKMPYYFLTYLNPPAYMITVFLGLVYILEHARSFCFNFIRDIVMMNTSNTIVNTMYGLTVLYYLTDNSFFGIINSIFKIFGSFFVKLDPKENKKESESKPDPEQPGSSPEQKKAGPKEKKKEPEREHKHRHDNSCNKCGMVTLNSCGLCGINVCGNCRMVHSCSSRKKHKKNEDEEDEEGGGGFIFPGLGISFDWLTGMTGDIFGWFNRVNVGVNMGGFELLIYYIFNLITSTINPIGTIIFFIIQFIIILAITVPFAGLFCFIVLFLICTSIFWHPFYEGDAEKIFTMWAIPGEIDEYMRLTFMLDFDPLHDDIGFSQVLLALYAIGYDYVYSNVFLIALFTLFVYAYMDFDTKIGNVILKQNLQYVMIFILLSNFLPLVTNLYSKLKQHRKGTEEQLARVKNPFGSNNPYAPNAEDPNATSLTGSFKSGYSEIKKVVIDHLPEKFKSNLDVDKINKMKEAALNELKNKFGDMGNLDDLKEKFKGKLGEMGNLDALKDKFKGKLGELGNLDELKDKFKGKLGELVNIDVLKDKFMSELGDIGNLDELKEKFKGKLSELGNLDELNEKFKGNLDELKNHLSNKLGELGNLDDLKDVFKGKLGELGNLDDLKNKFVGKLGEFGNLDNLKDRVKGEFGKRMSELKDKITSELGDLTDLDGLKEKLGDFKSIDELKYRLKKKYGYIGNILDILGFDKIREKLVEKYGDLDGFSEMKNKLKDKIGDVKDLDDLKNKLKGEFGNIGDIGDFKGNFNELKDKINENISTQNLKSEIRDGVTTVLNNPLTRFASGVVGKVGKFVSKVLHPDDEEDMYDDEDDEEGDSDSDSESDKDSDDDSLSDTESDKYSDDDSLSDSDSDDSIDEIIKDEVKKAKKE
jgi:hypothetical protein